MNRKEFDMIDNFPWQDWMRFMVSKKELTHRDLHRMSGVPLYRIRKWFQMKLPMDIHDLVRIMEVIGYRFLVMVGSSIDLDYFMRCQREGIRPESCEPVIVRGSVTNLRMLIKQVRLQRGILTADMEQLFDQPARKLYMYEQDLVQRMDFRVYLKVLTYMGVDWRFISGSVIAHGDPQHYSIEHFGKTEYAGRFSELRKTF